MTRSTDIQRQGAPARPRIRVRRFCGAGFSQACSLGDPAKHLVRFGGDEGVLQVGAAEVVSKSLKKGESRTWRYEDIDNISSSGPFQLTITTFERAKLDYGSLKQFNFERKVSRS